jgi:hypothetical protein
MTNPINDFKVTLILFLVINCLFIIHQKAISGEVANDTSDSINQKNVQTRQIYKTFYKDKVVYYHSSICCDIPSALVDVNGKLICYPDGGFVLRNQGCEDFVFDKTTAVKIEGLPPYIKKRKSKP